MTPVTLSSLATLFVFAALAFILVVVVGRFMRPDAPFEPASRVSQYAGTLCGDCRWRSGYNCTHARAGNELAAVMRLSHYACGPKGRLFEPVVAPVPRVPEGFLFVPDGPSNAHRVPTYPITAWASLYNTPAHEPTTEPKQAPPRIQLYEGRRRLDINGDGE